MDGNYFGSQPYSEQHTVSDQFDLRYGKVFVQVDGYTRGDGSSVGPHFRTHPDGIDYNNLSYGDNTSGTVIDMHQNMHDYTGAMNDSGFSDVMQQQDPLAHIDSYQMPPFTSS